MSLGTVWKNSTKIILGAVAAVYAFSQTHEGQALMVTHPRLTGVAALLGGILMLAHIPVQPAVVK